MKTIFKYPLALIRQQTLMVPSQRKALSVQAQYGQICLWMAVEPSYGAVSMQVTIVGTGHDIPDDGSDFVGTVQLDDFVWHVFVGV